MAGGLSVPARDRLLADRPVHARLPLIKDRLEHTVAAVEQRIEERLHAFDTRLDHRFASFSRRLRGEVTQSRVPHAVLYPHAHSCLIQEDEAVRIEVGRLGAPALPGRSAIRPVLFRSVQDFFYGQP